MIFAIDLKRLRRYPNAWVKCEPGEFRKGEYGAELYARLQPAEDVIAVDIRPLHGNKFEWKAGDVEIEKKGDQS